MPYNVDEEIEMLAGHIKRLGREEGGGVQVTFKVMSWTLLTGVINHIIIWNINFHSHTLSMHLFVVRGQPRMPLVLSPRKCIVLKQSFQELFDDDQVANTLESLAGTLKAAKKKAVVSYGPELLLQVTSTSWNFMLPNDTFSGYE